jgi:hypothetical protein
VKFPSYVPTAVQTYITEHVEGTQPPADAPNIPGPMHLFLARHQGLQAHISATRTALAELESEIETMKPTQQDALLDLNEHRELTRWHLKSLETRLSTLLRLATDDRMRLAYSHLIRDFANDNEKWQTFISAALEALEMLETFASDRADLRRAKELDKKIAKTAEQLIRLLSERNDLAINGPEEYSSPSGLFHRDSMELVQNLEQQETELLEKNGLYIFEFPPDGPPHESPPKRNSAGDACGTPDNFLDVLWQSSQYGKLKEDQRPKTIDIIKGIAIAAQKCKPGNCSPPASV